jgi:hypothetical protein
MAAPPGLSLAALTLSMAVAAQHSSPGKRQQQAEGGTKQREPDAKPAGDILATWQQQQHHHHQPLLHHHPQSADIAEAEAASHRPQRVLLQGNAASAADGAAGQEQQGAADLQPSAWGASADLSTIDTIAQHLVQKQAQQLQQIKDRLQPPSSSIGWESQPQQQLVQQQSQPLKTDRHDQQDNWTSQPEAQQAAVLKQHCMQLGHVQYQLGSAGEELQLQLGGIPPAGLSSTERWSWQVQAVVADAAAPGGAATAAVAVAAAGGQQLPEEDHLMQSPPVTTRPSKFIAAQVSHTGRLHMWLVCEDVAMCWPVLQQAERVMWLALSPGTACCWVLCTGLQCCRRAVVPRCCCCVEVLLAVPLQLKLLAVESNLQEHSNDCQQKSLPASRDAVLQRR